MSGTNALVKRAEARRPDIERAKGFAILLVVFGHLVARFDPAGVGWYGPLRVLVYLFHMPLFMYLSGCVATAVVPWAAWPAFVARRAARLLLPFAAFGLAILAGKLIAMHVVAVDNAPDSFGSGVWALVWDTARSPAESAWYLFTLFALACAVPPLARLCGGRVWPLLLPAAALYVLGAPERLYVDRIATYAPFFLAGMLAARTPGWTRALDRGACWTIPAFCLVLLAIGAGGIDVGVFGWPHKGYMLAVSCLAIPAVHGLVRSPLLAGSTTLLRLGGVCFTIYLLNTICIGLAKAAITAVVPWDGANFVPVAAALMAAGTLGPIGMRAAFDTLSREQQKLRLREARAVS